MNMNDELLHDLKQICPKGRRDILEGIAKTWDMAEEAKIDTPLRQAHFIAQMAKESDGFRVTEEYASGKAYEGRKDLGNTVAGDGVRFKGRGLIQTTGRANYTAFTKWCGGHYANAPDFVKDPTALGKFPWAFVSAIWYWDSRKLNVLADRDDVRGVTKKVNGGYNGLQERIGYLARAKAALAGDSTASLPVPPAQGQVKVAQARLKDLGYATVGEPDGHTGPQTIAALASFQAENGIEVNGQLDDTTTEALWSAPPRVIPDSKANGKPENDSVLEHAKSTLSTVVATGTAGAAYGVDQVMDKVSGVSGHWETLKEAMGPLREIGAAAADFWPFLVVGVAGFVGFKLWQMRKARIADFRAGKTC